jgi:hypothetical protein
MCEYTQAHTKAYLGRDRVFQYVRLHPPQPALRFKHLTPRIPTPQMIKEMDTWQRASSTDG